MITEPDFENLNSLKHDRTNQVWSLVVSVLFNLLLWMLVSWRVLMHLAGVGEQTREQVDMNVSEFEIQQRQEAVPERHAARAAAVPKPKSAPAPAARKEPVPKPQAQPTELARIVPNAPPQHSAPKRTQAASLTAQLAQQEAAFSREAQQLNANRSPVDVATADPNADDTRNTPYRASFSGTRVLDGKGEGYLYPLTRWVHDGLHCYYGRYDWIYPTGGTEVANIPWPFCFPPNADPIARGIHQFPFPEPLPGYQLPPGTDLAPIEKDVYEDWLAHQ